MGARVTIGNLSYPEVGATAGAMPPGYRHLQERLVVGHGLEWFETATKRLMSWEMHRRAGLDVLADVPAALGRTAVLGIRLGPVRIEAPVRIVAMMDVPGWHGIAYGTLPGHPESGEERFTVRLRDDGTVEAEIRAFSRPARWFSRLGGPLSRAIQDQVTRRYFAALS